MLKVKNLEFSYKETIVLSNINFDIGTGKSVAIIGESGSGKSTLLKLIYGLYDLEKGSINWNDLPILGPKYNLIPGMEFMKYLSQDFDLMPFITVSENIGKYLSNIYPEIKNARISEILEVVEMTEFSSVLARNLSGGQMQRVAIARVLALEPEVLLLDEPFSHIDTSRKNSLRRKLFSYLKKKEITLLIASHDITDVLSFSDEVLVLKNGKIIQKGISKLVYENPVSNYVAALFDEVTELKIDGKVYFLYPNKIHVVLKSENSAKVTACYYRGNCFLVEAILNQKKIFFNHPVQLEISSIVSIAFNLS